MNRTLPFRHLLAAAFILLLVGRLAAAEKITWKPVAAAVLKLDDRPVKLWNVYVAERKDHLILVQLGQRYLIIDTEAREVLEVAPAALKRKGKELRWERQKPRGEKSLPTEDWVIRDAGRARIVHLKLADEGRILEVQLPREQDFRSLY